MIYMVWTAKWTAYLKKEYYQENLECYDGCVYMNTRETMRDLCLCTFNGMGRCIVRGQVFVCLFV